MMYYVNWVLTNAQLELIAADVSVVDYNYGNKNEKKKIGEFDDTPADEDSIHKVNEDWIERHGDDGGVVNVSDILGGMQANVGIRAE